MTTHARKFFCINLIHVTTIMFWKYKKKCKVKYYILFMDCAWIQMYYLSFNNYIHFKLIITNIQVHSSPYCYILYIVMVIISKYLTYLKHCHPNVELYIIFGGVPSIPKD